MTYRENHRDNEEIIVFHGHGFLSTVFFLDACLTFISLSFFVVVDIRPAQNTQLNSSSEQIILSNSSVNTVRLRFEIGIFRFRFLPKSNNFGFVLNFLV